MINRTIKGYEIQQLIATGGMAAIYRAVQSSTGQTVAIKVLHGHLAQDKDFITRFEREARAAADLKHENIIDIFGYGEAEGVYYIAMEFVEGKSLKELINSVKFIPHDIALAIAYEICQGIEHAHQKGVVHRDIKPANILLSKKGQLKITDFGLAQAQDLTSITVTGAIVGTPAYMSPEQAAGKRIDTRSDLFSLGVVIYEMITGTKPFQGESYSSVIHAILTIPAPKPTDVNPTVSGEISTVLVKMLQTDAEKRYQNVSQVSDDIYAYFRARNTEVPSKQITAFINDPVKVAETAFQQEKETYLKRALYYTTLGKTNIDDAISEFVKVQYLDPNNTQANTHLAELRRKRKVHAPKKKKSANAPPRRNFIKVAGIFGALFVVTMFAAALYRNYSNNRSGPNDHGLVYVTSNPGQAAVYLDSSNLNLKTPVRIDSISAGDHTIEIRRDGYQTYSKNIMIKPGDSISLEASLIKVLDETTTGSITISTKPNGAQVFIDGANTGLQTPCTIQNLRTGRHNIKIAKSGYVTAELTPNIQSGKTVTVTRDLSKTGSSTARRNAQKSYFKINVDPWAKVYIDGKYIETTPIAQAIAVVSGNHTVRLDNPSFQVWQKRINFSPGETVALDIKLDPFAGYLKISVRPWADVYIDGKFHETTPIAEPIQLPAGRHTLKLINPSFIAHEEVITVVANQTTRKSVELIPK
jgi:serine/threonine protein kinase